jgi:serine/threonine protein kinase
MLQQHRVWSIRQVLASKTKIYLVLEYVSGGELFSKILNQGRLREDQSRKYFQQLIDAVDYCHSRRVYHRDLKVGIRGSQLFFAHWQSVCDCITASLLCISVVVA